MWIDRQKLPIEKRWNHDARRFAKAIFSNGEKSGWRGRGRGHLLSVDTGFDSISIFATSIRLPWEWNSYLISMKSWLWPVVEKYFINAASPGSATSTTFPSFWLIINFVLEPENHTKRQMFGKKRGECATSNGNQPWMCSTITKYYNGERTERNLMDSLPFLCVVVCGWARFIDARPVSFKWMRHADEMGAEQVRFDDLRITMESATTDVCLEDISNTR